MDNSRTSEISNTYFLGTLEARKLFEEIKKSLKMLTRTCEFLVSVLHTRKLFHLNDRRSTIQPCKYTQAILT